MSFMNDPMEILYLSSNSSKDYYLLLHLIKGRIILAFFVRMCFNVKGNPET